MLNKDNIEIIYPRIMVFRNGISEPEKIVEQLSKFSNWDKWYDIGEQILFNPMCTHQFNNFPTRNEWYQSHLEPRNKVEPEELRNLIELFEEKFFESTEHYINHYHCTKPNWLHLGSNILRYEGREAKESEIKGQNQAKLNRDEETGKIDKSHYDTTKGEAGGTKEMTLPFHTDFYQADEFEPGLKAEYTVTMYLNDDYDGGEIDFRIFNRRETEMRVVDGEMVPTTEGEEIPKIVYKPQAGDIIIFPSRVPFYHGVRRVSTGTKYFARMFWMSRQD
jgi:hypothetical protein